MERVRILELKQRYLKRKGKKVTQEEIAEAVFKGDKISDARKKTLISRWNNGHDLSALEPRHIDALGRFFEVNDYREIIANGKQ